MTTAILTDLTVEDRSGWRAVVENGVLVELSPARPASRGAGLDAQGASLVPALHDHHVHLRAEVARSWSVDLRHSTCRADLAAALSRARPGPDGWVRGVGYDEDRVGWLTRTILDTVRADAVPVKVQHRSGHLWVLNSVGCEALGETGVRIDADGLAWDQDARMPGAEPTRAAIATGLRALCRAIRAQGCVGVTDMTAGQTRADIRSLADAGRGWLDIGAYGGAFPDVAWQKILIEDHDLPDPDHLARRIAGAGRAAVHAVSREAAALLVAAIGPHGGRVRLEHGFVLDPDLIAMLARTGMSVGVQPGFILSRGDGLIRQLAAADLADYQRLRSLKNAGLTLFGGTDRPFAVGDVWAAMAAAVDRRTRTGASLGPDEALTPEEAFALFTPTGLRDGAGAPRVRVGDAGAFCLLDRSWRAARDSLGGTRVRLTVPAANDSGTAAPSPSRRRGIYPLLEEEEGREVRHC